MTESDSMVKLHYEIYGSGDPVLCLHGFGANLFTWRHLVKPLSEKYQLILVDLKGFGASPKPKDKLYSGQDHVDLIYQLILELDLKNLTLVGNSFGGALALLLAIRLAQEEPNRLASLFLIAPGAYKEYVPHFLNLVRIPLLGELAVQLLPARLVTNLVLQMAYCDRKKTTREQVEKYARPLTEPGARKALLQTAKQLVPRNIDEFVEKIKTISVPTLILFGDHDRIVNPIVGDKLHAAIQHSRLLQLDHCGHIPQEEKPAETVALLLEFLAGLSPAA
jgi:pimeloyl-ACP methyl ester carboxylesterase